MTRAAGPGVARRSAAPLTLQPTCGGTHAGDWVYAVKRDHDPVVAAPWAYQKQAVAPRPAKQPLAVDMPVPHL
ncbi:expressed protein [Chlorella variabilis]|uniref:Expressed protein n=1 Tax=Chlorella variabilis TaxID=554065 RepID=E1ZCF2_CHLVA|nr:expressed protein [Chlorella variabilis]EFN56594.1 expressed protein [Chlorella variabilis]|eukprot:XP_005848696.1 expressed protein [Chlorella variabilis]